MRIEKNIGRKDRAARIIVGIIMLLSVTLSFIGPHSSWALLGLLGILPITAGVLGRCPPYDYFGINTYEGKSEISAVGQ